MQDNNFSLGKNDKKRKQPIKENKNSTSKP